jgi:integrase
MGRFLLPEELPPFFEAVYEESNPLLQGFFLLCLLTGARRSNVQAMRWAEISWELHEWRIATTKAGFAVVVPLCPLAVDILQKLREHVGVRVALEAATGAMLKAVDDAQFKAEGGQ